MKTISLFVLLRFNLLRRQNWVLLGKLHDSLLKFFVLDDVLLFLGEALDLHDSIFDFIFTQPHNQGNAIVESVLNLLLRLWVVVIKSFRFKSGFPK